MDAENPDAGLVFSIAIESFQDAPIMCFQVDEGRITAKRIQNMHFQLEFQRQWTND